MTFSEMYVEINKNSTHFITEEMFFGDIPNWYNELYKPNASGIDRRYLFQLYPNSETIENWDKNGSFAYLTLPSILAENKYKFNNLYRTTTQIYNPIENYDRNEITEFDGTSNSNNSTSLESSNIKNGNEETLKTGDVTNLKSGNETNTKSGNEELLKTGDITNLKSGNETSTKSGNEELLKTGDITNLKNGNETNIKSGNINNSKNGTEELTKSGSEKESTLDSGSETHTTSGEIKETNQQRAFNSGLVETSNKVVSSPISGTDVLTFDSRKNEKETLFTNRKDTTVYNNVSDITTYDNVTDTTTYNDVSDKTSFNDVKETTTYNNVSDTTTYNDVSDKTSFNDVKETTSYNNVSDTYNSNTETSGNSSNKTKTNSRIHGNIGVTTTAQMLEGERMLSEFDFIDILMKTILFELSAGYVVGEEEYH